MRIRFIRLIRCFYFLHPNNLCVSVKSVGEYAAINSVSSVCSVGECYYGGGCRGRSSYSVGAALALLAQFLLGWCISCSVGALETSAPPKCATVRVRRPIGFRSPSDWIPSAVRSDSVRRPLGFRPPSARIPSAVRLDSVRRRWKSVGKNVARTLCSTAILSATSPSLT